VEQGRVRLLNDQRDRGQIESLCARGLFLWPAPPAQRTRPDRAAPGAPTAGADAIARPLDDEAAGSSALGTRRSPAGSAVNVDRAAAVPDVEMPLKPLRAEPVPVATEPPIELFQMLNALADHSSEKKPLVITSLLRPPYKTARYSMQSPTNPHALGIAVDIAAFEGHAVLTADPEEEVQACLALLKSLAPGRYRMGLPKAPEPPTAVIPGAALPDDVTGDPSPPDPAPVRTPRSGAGALPSRGVRRQDGVHRPLPPAPPVDPPPAAIDQAPSAPAWPFFPPQQRTLDTHGRPVTLFANEHYAAEEFLNDARIRSALAEARRRGVDVFALFPDGVNHIHVDVKQAP
jgi:hypothetical protein